MTMTRADKRAAEYVTKRGAVAPITNPVQIAQLGSRYYTRAQYVAQVLGRRPAASDQIRQDVAERRALARRLGIVRRAR